MNSALIDEHVKLTEAQWELILYWTIAMIPLRKATTSDSNNAFMGKPIRYSNIYSERREPRKQNVQTMTAC